ncbi:MAG TPA: ferritin [Gemmatimonadales bacterium]|nr:ferritin [Gemmatimonadales bacterium]
MRLSKKIQAAMNEQMCREFGAYYLYLAMAAWFGQRNFDGFSRWMRAQAQEEAGHAMKLFDYIIDRSGVINLDTIERPKADWKSVLAVFEAARAHEARVSDGINGVYELAVAQKDYASQAMLQWFVTEQVEEEKTSTHIVETLRIIGDSASGLLFYDRELGTRNQS